MQLKHSDAESSWAAKLLRFNNISVRILMKLKDSDPETPRLQGVHFYIGMNETEASKVVTSK